MLWLLKRGRFCRRRLDVAIFAAAFLAFVAVERRVGAFERAFDVPGDAFAIGEGGGDQAAGLRVASVAAGGGIVGRGSVDAGGQRRARAKVEAFGMRRRRCRKKCGGENEEPRGAGRRVNHRAR